MEVHQHTHTPRKKWTHYFWEFLMLFLAVFCGFLAEYQLEHTIEHQREKKYILSLLEDLKTDTSRIQSYLQFREMKVKKTDSLIHLLVTSDYKNKGSETYFFAKMTSRGVPFFSADGTMQQLKNAGGLRLITKQNAVDSIMAYDIAVRGQRFQDDAVVNAFERFKEIAEEAFRADIFYQNIDSYGPSYLRPNGNPQLMTNNPVVINKLAVRASYINNIEKTSIDRVYLLKSRAIRLIGFLQKEYHLN
jgi:hypothetical protein